MQPQVMVCAHAPTQPQVLEPWEQAPLQPQALLWEQAPAAQPHDLAVLQLQAPASHPHPARPKACNRIRWVARRVAMAEVEEVFRAPIRVV